MNLKVLIALRAFALGALFLVTTTGFGGCSLRSVEKEEIPGNYTSPLPGGGSETLTLGQDGSIQQKIVLTSGRILSTNGKWVHNSAQNTVKLRGIYITVDIEGKLNAKMENTTDTLCIFALKRNKSGKILLGYEEGRLYEKQ
jgi:hypothetical protein